MGGVNSDFPYTFAYMPVIGCFTDQDGSVTFSIADLPQGIYIIKSESLTCKILKQ